MKTETGNTLNRLWITSVVKAILLAALVLTAAGGLYVSELRPGAAGNTAVAADMRPTLVDLGADRCMPCRMMVPILEELEKQYKGKFDIVFYDVWKDPAPAEKYGIHGIPTQIFLDETGKELYRHAGYFSKEQILNKWKELGYDFQQKH